MPGKEEPSDMNRNFYQPSHMSFASAPQHQVQQSISPNERLNSVEQPHYSFHNSSAEPETDVSNQPLDFGPRYGHDHGPFGQSTVPGMPYSSMPSVHSTIQQADPSMGISSPVSLPSAPLFGRISSFQPAISSANTSFPIGVSNAFHGDMYGTPGFPERPKKASVPNWLREEIIKKKAVIGSSAPEVSRQDIESNEDEFMDHKGDQGVAKSMESTRSTEEEGDDEDDVEAARTAAINQEIKRILTEVLLKVTDDLFDEIATKVIEEDDLKLEVERKADNTSAATTPKSTAKVIISTNTKRTGAADSSGKSDPNTPGDVLGLGSYASDDDDDEKQVQNLPIPSFNNSKPPIQQAENGSSQVEESDSHRVGPNVAIESHNDKSSGEKVKPSDFSKSKLSVSEDGLKAKNLSHDDSQGRSSRNGAIESHSDKSGGEAVKHNSSDISKSKQSLTEDGLNAKNSSHGDFEGRSSRNEPDKSGNDKKHIKVDENNRVHDERDRKRAKKEDQSKEKIKFPDSGKRVSKAEAKDDREERERDVRSQERERDKRSLDREGDKRSRRKEDSRKREKEKDDKNERKSKPVGDSKRHKRYHSPSPGRKVRRSKDNGSSDSSSEDSRRKVHSKRRDLSPSPVRSRRKVSRSPSKHSHRRHSNISSLEATRERRRSRSGSRSRRG